MKHLYEVDPVPTPYTNDDKIIIYKRVLKYMLADIEKDIPHGLCHYMIRGINDLRAMQSVTINRAGFLSEETMETTSFPELIKYKPFVTVNSYGVPGGVYWFALDPEGMEKRVSIVTEILTNLKLH